MSVFDPDALDRLVEDTGSREFTLCFARTYVAMLDTRLTRIVTALHGEDDDAAMEAVLSLKVSCATTGATELAVLARTVEDDLRRQDWCACRSHAQLLAPAAGRARAAITAYVADQGQD